MKTYLQALRYLRPYRWRVAAGLACLLVATPLSLVHPWIWRYIVDEVVLRRRPDLLAPALAGMVGVHLVSAALRAAQQNLLGRVARRFVQDVRNDVYVKLQSQSLEYLQSRPSGDLISRMTGDVDLLQSMVLGVTESSFTNVYAVGVAGLAIAALHPVLAVITLPPILAVWLVTRAYNARVLTLYRAGRSMLGDVSTRLQETLAGIMVIKVFGKEAQQAAGFRKATDALRGVETRALNAQTLFYPGVEFLAFVSNSLGVGIAAYLILQGRFSLGGLVAYRAYSARMMDPIFQLAQVSDQLQRGAAAGERVFALLDADVTPRDAPDALTLPEVRGRVTWERVSFGYGDRPLLRDVNLDVTPGEIVAIVGGSGSGKSTLLSLVPRLWDPQEGRVLIDGVDVRTVSQHSLRRHLAVVLQDTFLFSGTVLENVRYARPEATLEEVRAAATASNALRFIEEELPHGWETEVGERGVKLSGGQRQRLSLARAFLADPRILILDEPTSAVEPESEWLIQQAIENLTRNRTTFLVSHRLSLVRNAHRIVVLHEGRVVEQGTHAHLLARDGWYASMHQLQSGALPTEVPRSARVG
jgi:ABC-type multidrug transport system fused ATPase/permease subunit